MMIIGCLSFAVITECLRIAKKSIRSKQRIILQVGTDCKRKIFTKKLFFDMIIIEKIVVH